MNKICVTGSSGFVGKQVYQTLNKFNDVVGLARSKSSWTDVQVDISKREELFKVLDNIQPRVIVHTAYYPNVEGCEENKELVEEINIKGTVNIVDWCRNNNCKIVFLSTDYVYSLNGDKLNNEADPTGSMNIYTQCKIDNEEYIKQNLTEHLIIRTGFIYGFDKESKNFLMQMIQKKGDLEVPDDQIVNPTYVGFLASAIEKAVDKQVTGTFNCNGRESISRYEFARKIAEIFRLPIMPRPKKTSDIPYKAKRPLFCRIDSSKIYEIAGESESIERYLRQIKSKNMENTTYTRDTCRGCSSKRLSQVLTYGNVPIANSFQKGVPDMNKIPLDIFFCEECSLIQILDIVPQEDLFLDYRYVSSVSQKVMNHFAELADTMQATCDLKENEFIVEIGSNDGVLQRPLKRKGIRCIGFEPSLNVSKMARKEGFETINAFFNEKNAKNFVKRFGKAKVISASNVLAHIDDMDDIMRSIDQILEDNGILIVEVHYIVPLIEKLEFDNFYHEHLCEYSVTAFHTMLKRHNLELFDVEKIPIHGGSVRFFAKKKDSSRPIKGSVHAMEQYEKEQGFTEKSRYVDFAGKIEGLKKALIGKLDEIKSQGKKIAGYGASARGTIMLNVCGIDERYLEYVIDSNPEKQDRYIPGMNVKIQHPSHLKEKTPDYILLIAYTYANEIMNAERWFKGQGGIFLNPHDFFME